MAKVKRGVITHARHKKVIDAAKGYYGRRKNVFRVAKQAVEYQIATQSELESIATAWRSWARKPNAFFSFIHVEGLAYVSRS